jgi:membrane-bound lytic murein transglycosylase D
LLATAASCGVHEPPQVAAPQQPLVVVEERLPQGDLTHPRTVPWMRRFCAKMARGPVTALGLGASRPIRTQLEAILVEHGLPRQLSAVPAVESRYRQDARGRHGELGLWQLKPATARRFGLEVNARRDERAHVDPSTRAAARYLAYLHARYADWPLALAAYNAGEGRVDRALAHRPGATFWDLAEKKALPPVSREYVPKILAAARVTSEPSCCRRAVAADSTLAHAPARFARPRAPRAEFVALLSGR